MLYVKPGCGEMGNRLQASKHLGMQPVTRVHHFSLATLSWITSVGTSESWEVNMSYMTHHMMH